MRGMVWDAKRREKSIRIKGVGPHYTGPHQSILPRNNWMRAWSRCKGERIMGSIQENNKKAVTQFYDLIINKKDYEAAKPFIGKRYKQHNPLVKDFPEGLKEFIEFLKENFPEARSEIKRVIAEDDYVVLHVHSIRSKELERAIIEIFRLENGRIEEHWDVIQEIPEISANPNGMF